MTFLGIRVRNPRTYNLIIEYVDQDGNTLASTYTLPLTYGATYSVPSPEIEGYTVSEQQQVISGTMPARSVLYRVVYVADITDINVAWDFVVVQSPNFDGSATDPIVAGKQYIVSAELTNEGLSDLRNVQFTCALSNDIYNFNSVDAGEIQTQAFSYVATDADVSTGTITFIVTLTADTDDPDNPSITDSATYTFGVQQ